MSVIASASATLPVAEEEPFLLEEQIGQLIRRAHQRATASFLSHMGQGDLTPPQFAALFKLLEEGMVSQNSLGRMIAMDAATMQGVVHRLHQRGLVERQSDPVDRRRIQLSLTALGRKTVLDALDKAQASSREILNPLSARDQQTLLRLLKRIC